MMKLHYEDVQGYLTSKLVSYYKGGEQGFFDNMTSINAQMIISTHVEAFLAHLQQECVHALLCTCPFASWMLSSLYCVSIQAQACDQHVKMDQVMQVCKEKMEIIKPCRKVQVPCHMGQRYIL